MDELTAFVNFTAVPYLGESTMVESVARFFGIIGLDVVPPETLAELIPYLFQVVVGVCLVAGVFKVIGKLAEILINFRRW